MPLELGVWRIDSGVRAVESRILNLESRLEEILGENIGMLSPNWMVIGRQVPTGYGGLIDLLAMDRDANLVVIELKRGQTPRDIVAQLLDYGSWVTQLKSEDVATIFNDFQERWRLGQTGVSINDAFKKAFGIAIPDEVNASHELVIVAAELDPATERIVRYLAEKYQVRINAVFFRTFEDDAREYLTRAWFRDPSDVTAEPPVRAPGGEWNGEYYVSFGYPLDVVRDGLARGYIVAGGGSWYSRTLQKLQPCARIWVNVPGSGYVGVATVESTMVPAENFLVLDEDGKEVRLIDVSSPAERLNRASDNPETADYLVRVKWLKTVDPSQAVREMGFFGNQNSVAQPTTAKWDHIVERLKAQWGIN